MIVAVEFACGIDRPAAEHAIAAGAPPVKSHNTLSHVTMTLSIILLYQIILEYYIKAYHTSPYSNTFVYSRPARGVRRVAYARA